MQIPVPNDLRSGAGRWLCCGYVHPGRARHCHVCGGKQEDGEHSDSDVGGPDPIRLVPSYQNYPSELAAGAYAGQEREAQRSAFEAIVGTGGQPSDEQIDAHNEAPFPEETWWCRFCDIAHAMYVLSCDGCNRKGPGFLPALQEEIRRQTHVLAAKAAAHAAHDAATDRSNDAAAAEAQQQQQQQQQHHHDTIR